MKKTLRLFALALLFLMMIHSFAFAATGGPMSTVLGDIIEVAAYALGITLAALIALAAKWVAAKFKVEMPQTWMASANVWIDKGIHYAEEWAKNRIEKNDTINGNDKLNTAVNFVLSMTDDKKLVQMSKDELAKLIEARLGEHRGGFGMSAALLTPLDAKLLAIGEDGAVKVHLTNGDEVDITEALTNAGFTRTKKEN